MSFALLVMLGSAPSRVAVAQLAMGRVAGTPAQKGLAGIRVSLLDAKARAVDSTLTDSTGAFYLNARGPGRYRLEFAQRALWIDLSQDFELAKDEVRDGVYVVVDHSGDRVLMAGEVEREAMPLPGQPAPLYPPELRRRGLQGGVFLRFTVDAAGRVASNSAQVISATSAEFVDAVLAVVYRWRFQPAMLNGAAVPETVCSPFTFQLTSFGGTADPDARLDSLIATWPPGSRCPKANPPARQPNER